MARRSKDTPPLYKDDPYAQVVSECGGLLVRVKLRPPTGENGGCGTRTHVVGTNAGTMPCGSMLTEFGVTKPYYCASCYEARRHLGDTTATISTEVA